ncbi:hypothetical protein BB561_001457 [Smittium simulii]|uniref:Uncharacterized protein n=1 Tax=Smittium simulii TaxID=133385 RepID=A0A2T9YUG0_9FUNG|nr:hypothetical protein BB561_001457 [Smittium simulii]
MSEQIDSQFLFKLTRFSVKLPNIDFKPDNTISSVLNSQARKIVFRGENIRAYLIAQLPHSAVVKANQALSNQKNTNKSGFLSPKNRSASVLSQLETGTIPQEYFDSILNFFYLFRFGITAYVKVVKNFDTLENAIDKRSDSIISTTSVENKVPISIQVGHPTKSTQPEHSENSDSFPFMFDWSTSTGEWIAIYDLSQDSLQEIESKNINSQIISLSDISSWVTDGQNQAKNINSSISQLGKCVNPQNLITQKPLNQTLLSNTNSLLKTIYTAEDIDKNALISIPQRLFYTSIKSIPLITLGYRLVQSASFCSPNSLYLEVVALNNSNLALSGDPNNSNLSQQIVKLSSLKVNPVNLFLTRLGDFQSSDSTSEITTDNQNENSNFCINSLECLKEPKILRPGEIWSEIFCIAISSFKTTNKDLKRSESIFHSAINGDISESQLSIYGNDSKLTITADGYICNQSDGLSYGNNISLKKPDLLHHRVDVDILSLIESIQNNSQFYKTLNYMKIINKITNTPINYCTSSFIQTFGGFGEESGIKDSLDYKHIVPTIHKDNTYHNTEYFVCSNNISPRTKLPQIKFFPLTSSRPVLITNFMEKYLSNYNAFINSPDILKSYSIDANQSQPVKVTIKNVPRKLHGTGAVANRKATFGRIRLDSINIQNDDNQPPRARSIVSLASNKSPVFKNLMQRKFSKAASIISLNSKLNLENNSELSLPNTEYLLSNITSQLNPVFEKITRIGLAVTSESPEDEYNANLDDESCAQNNLLSDNDGLIHQFSNNPLFVNLQKLNNYKSAKVTSDKNSIDSSTSENLQKKSTFSQNIKFGNIADNPLFAANSIENVGITISLRTDSIVKLGDIVNVIVTIANHFPFTLSGLSICTAREDSDPFDLDKIEHYYDNQDIPINEFSSNQADAPFKSNILPLDHTIELRPILAGVSETMTIRYIASDLEFCSIGSLFLYLLDGKHSENHADVWSGNSTPIMQASNSLTGSNFGSQMNSYIDNKSLIAEFETPLMVFVE